MKKIALIAASVLVAALAGCSSSSDPTAPVESRRPGVTAGGGAAPGAGGPGTGRTAPPTIDVTKQQAGGVPEDLKRGILGQRSVYFEFDSNEVGEKYRPMLQAHAGYLQKNSVAKMMVQGNTDERGSREYNLALGQRRAEAVKRMLVLMGAREPQIETVSFGEEKPRRPGSDEAAYAENRRGDILYGGEF